MGRRILAVALVLGISPTSAHCADSDGVGRREAELERRVERLAAENLRLRKELEEARRQLDAGPATPDRPIPAARPGAAASSRPTTTRAAERRPDFASVPDCVGGLPERLRPKPGVGWDKFDQPKVDAWLKERVVGRTLQLPLAVEGLTVKLSPADPKRRQWRVAMRLTAPPGSLPPGASAAYRVRFANEVGDRVPGPGLKRVDETILALSFDCEEQEARQWDGRTRSMLSLPVVATIQEATLQVTDSRVSTLTVKLTGLQGLEPNGLLNRTVKSPPTRR